MTVAEAKALEADIAEHGIQVPLDITAAGVVLDGRHRHRAALALGLDQVPVRVVDADDEVEFMFRMALLRRHLSAGQKALLVLERDEYRTTRAAAERRKRANLRNSSLDVATLPHRGRSRARVAERAGVSERTVQYAIRVIEHGDLDLVERVATDSLSVEKAAREVARRERYARMGEAQPLPTGIFDLIYADPPWALGSSVEQHYPTMPTAEIAALNIPAAVSAALFVWEVTGMRADSMTVIDSWGFTFKGEFVWVKPSIGPGNYVLNRHEKLLIATRGNFPTPLQCFDSVVDAPRGRHSEKPKVFYELIERMYPSATRLELFARGKPRPGWTFWGNEVEQ
jgi:N6-adenosine-specific RNA methylase IME4